MLTFKKLINQNFFLYFCIFSLWFSLDTSFFNFNKDIFLNYKNIFIFIRGLLLYLIFFTYLFFIFKYKKIASVVSANYFLQCIFLIFITQSISIFFSNNNLLNISYSLNCLIYLFFLTECIYNEKILKKIFYLSIFFLFFILLIYGSTILKWFYLNTKDLNLYGSWPHGLHALQNLSNDIPRSSGLGRSSMIILIFVSICMTNCKKKFLVLYFFVVVFCSLIIFLTQSRLVIIFYILYFLVYFISILYTKNLTKKKIYLFISIIIFPFFFWYLSFEYKNKLRDYITNTFYYSHKDNNQNEYRATEYEKPFRTVDPKTLTSNRVRDWKNIISFNKNKFLGNGSMGDRFLINQTASNFFVYLYASAGLVGVLLGIILYLQSLSLIIKNLLSTKLIFTRENNLNLICTAIISFLLLRGITETSFGIFGIDFLIFFISFFYLNYKTLKGSAI